jgi:2,4-dienoyl-CoA reductase-like NADH-dependent reductase (Old Yellow Enzyme family)
MLGVRLSPERFGLKLGEIKILAEELMISDKIDFLDMSLWDVFKEPEEEEYKGRSLLSYFTELERGVTKLGVAGNIRTPKDAERVMESGVDWVMLGRAAILHHDFPNKYHTDPSFIPIENPVSRQHLRNEGLSKKFIEYMSGWKGFVKEETDSVTPE